MAKQRMVNGKFWSDAYVRTLEKMERYLFLYFLTNEHTNIAGIYELPIDIICFETKLEEKETLFIINKLEKDKKINYKKNWIYVINFIKNQNLNPSVITGIKRVLSEIPSNIHDRLGTGWGEAGGRLSELNLTKLNLTETTNKDVHKEKKYEFIEIDFKHPYSLEGKKYGKYRLYMGKDKLVYGKDPNQKQYIPLLEIKKNY